MNLFWGEGEGDGNAIEEDNGNEKKTLNFLFFSCFENKVKLVFFGIKFVVSIDLFLDKLKYFFVKKKQIILKLILS